MVQVKSNNRESAVKVVVDYAIAVVIVLSTASIWSVANDSSMTFDLLRYAYSAVLFAGVIVSAVIYKDVKHNITALALTVAIVVVCSLYIMINRANMFGYIRFFLMPVTLGIVCCLLNKGDMGVISRLSNIVFILAAASLILYALGPLTGLIEPTGSISFTWAFPRSCHHYFSLLYCSQQIELEGISIIRNCGIFAEAPMFNILLCIALAYEVFIRDRARKPQLIILAATIITTVSTTGLLVLLLTALFKYAVRIIGAEGMTLGKIVLPFLLVAIFIGCIYLLNFKTSYSMGSDSVSIRSDHLFACFDVFLRHPLFGIGYNQEEAVLGYSSYQQGMSVGLPYYMATGGLVLSLLWIVPQIRVMLNCIRHKRYDDLAFTIVIFLLYFLTAVTYRPLMEYLLAFFLIWKFEDRAELDSISYQKLPIGKHRSINAIS